MQEKRRRWQSQAEQAEEDARAAQEELQRVRENARADADDLHFWRDHAEQLQVQVDELREAPKVRDAELRSLKVRVDELEKLQDQRNGELMEIQVDLEVCKHRDLEEGPRLSLRPHLAERAEVLLRRVPPGHHGACDRMRNIRVLKVEEVINMRLWPKYATQRGNMVQALKGRHACPWIEDLASPVQWVHDMFSYINLESTANEVLLLHGTTKQNAKKILREGFDDRLSARALYGDGIYFSTDPCKIMQYCDEDATGQGSEKCAILARVLLGHPYVAEAPRQGQRRPPPVHGTDELHDSVVAQPGVTVKGKGKGKGRQQVHWEFVVLLARTLHGSQRAHVDGGNSFALVALSGSSPFPGQRPKQGLMRKTVYHISWLHCCWHV